MAELVPNDPTGGPSALEPAGERLGVLVGGSSHMSQSEKRVVYSIDLVDLDRDSYRGVAVDFLAHGFTMHPDHPHVAAFFEKRGPDACVVHLADARVIAPIVASPGRAFYGHGLYSPDGAHLFAVEIRTDTHAGLITVRDAKNLRPIDELPTYGENPHDCVLLDDKKTLAITNGGGELGTKWTPCVTFVDLPSRRLLEKVTLSDPKLNAGHIAIAKNGDFALVSAPRDGLPDRTSLGGVTLRTRKRKPERMRAPEAVTSRMVGESLSVAIHEPTRTVAVTTPYANLVTFWDLDRKKLRKHLDLEAARGVTRTLDGRLFVITFGARGSRALVDPETLEVLEGSERTTGRFTGSHVYVFSAAAIQKSAAPAS